MTHDFYGIQLVLPFTMMKIQPPTHRYSNDQGSCISFLCCFSRFFGRGFPLPRFKALPLLSRLLPSSNVVTDPRPAAARPRSSVPAKSGRARDRSRLQRASFSQKMCEKTGRFGGFGSKFKGMVYMNGNFPK